MNRFAKVRVTCTREGLVFEVLAQVVCTRSNPPDPIKNRLVVSHTDLLCRRLPNLPHLEGEQQIRKVRLTTLGYDRCDRAIKA